MIAISRMSFPWYAQIIITFLSIRLCTSVIRYKETDIAVNQTVE